MIQLNVYIRIFTTSLLSLKNPENLMSILYSNNSKTHRIQTYSYNSNNIIYYDFIYNLCSV